jgi:outer membrane murein-binding lipoprotein Lpp
MGRLRNWWYWLAARDPSLNADQKLSRWANLSGVASPILAGGIWLFGWVLNIPWQVALFAGLAAWVVLLNGAVALGRVAVRREESQTTVDLQQLESRLGEVEQDRNRVRADKDALKEELEQAKEELEKARSNASEVYTPTAEQEDSRAVIERLEAENERLRETAAKRDADRVAFRGMLISAHSGGCEAPRE